MKRKSARPTPVAFRKRKKAKPPVPKTLREGLHRFLPTGLDVHHDLILAYAVQDMESVRDPRVEAELARNVSLETVHFWVQQRQWIRAWNTYRSIADPPGAERFSVEWTKWTSEWGKPGSDPPISLIEAEEVLPFGLLTAEANQSYRTTVNDQFWTEVVPRCPELFWLDADLGWREAPQMFEAVLRTGESWRLQYLLYHDGPSMGVDEMWCLVLETCDSPPHRDACIDVIRGVGYLDPIIDTETLFGWKAETVRFALASREIVPHPLNVAADAYSQRDGEFIDDLYTFVTPDQVGSRYSLGALLSPLKTSALLVREIDRLALWFQIADVDRILHDAECTEGWNDIVACLARVCPDFSVATLRGHVVAGRDVFNLEAPVLRGLLHQWPTTPVHDLALLANWSCEETVQFLLDCGWQGPVDDSMRIQMIHTMTLQSAHLLLRSGILEQVVRPGEYSHWRNILDRALSSSEFRRAERWHLLRTLALFLPMHRHEFSLHAILALSPGQDDRAVRVFLQALPCTSLVQSLLQPFSPLHAQLLAQRLHLPLKDGL